MKSCPGPCGCVSATWTWIGSALGALQGACDDRRHSPRLHHDRRPGRDDLGSPSDAFHAADPRWPRIEAVEVGDVVRDLLRVDGDGDGNRPASASASADAGERPLDCSEDVGSRTELRRRRLPSLALVGEDERSREAGEHLLLRCSGRQVADADAEHRRAGADPDGGRDGGEHLVGTDDLPAGGRDDRPEVDGRAGCLAPELRDDGLRADDCGERPGCGAPQRSGGVAEHEGDLACEALRVDARKERGGGLRNRGAARRRVRDRLQEPRPEASDRQAVVWSCT